MLRVAVRSLLAHKVRLLLSGFAIVLGVAFVAGSFVFTDTLERSFTAIIGGTQPDAVVRPISALSGVGGPPGTELTTQTLPESLVTTVAAADGVLRADGNVTAPFSTFLLDRNGRVVGGQGAPGIATNWNDAPTSAGEPGVTVETGRAPERAGEVVVDIDTAEKAGYDLGQQVQIVTTGEPSSFDATLVGTIRFGADNNLVGASLLGFTTSAAQQLFFDGEPVFTDISVTTDPARDVDAIVQSLSQIVPEGAQVLSGADLAEEEQQVLATGLSFVNTFLLVFAFVALVVGVFLIVNTFAILVAQRVRELALLRAMGASRRQVTRTVLVEALAVGIAGSTVGLLLGFGLALLLKFLFGLVGLDLGNAPLVFQPRTAIWAYAVGVLVTLLAAYLPARRAARIPPVAAMRDDIALPQSSLRLRAIMGGFMLLIGVVALTLGLNGVGGTREILILVGVGVLGILLGVSLVLPLLAPAVIAVIAAGYPRLFGAIGRMARENARRNPRRTAATSSALMLGLALVAALAVIGDSTKRSVDELLATDLRADYIVSNVAQQPFAPSIAQRFAQVDGVAVVAPFRFAFAQVDGDLSPVAAVEPSSFAQVVDVTMLEGRLDALRSGMVLVSGDAAESNGWSLGDSIETTFPTGVRELEIAGVFEANQILGAPVIASFDDLAQGGVPVADFSVYVSRDPNADPATVQAALNEVVAGLPLVAVQDQDEFSKAQYAQVNQILGILYALLGLAIVIAVLGIVNTLALSVIERTREIGLLRAVGMSRRQLRRMVRLESVVIAVLGAVVGVAMGLVFGVSLQRATASQGINVLGVPYVQLALFVVLAGLVGMLAAVWPARRAARLDVLRAITTE